MTFSEPSRRDLLTGRLLSLGPVREAHLSSLVVHARPESHGAVRAAIAALPGAEIHAEAECRFVLTLETESEDQIVEALRHLDGVPGVMSTALVFHHIEPAEPDGDRHGPVAP